METLNSELYEERGGQIVCFDSFSSMYDEEEFSKLFDLGKDIVITKPLEESDIYAINDEHFVIPEWQTLYVNPLEILANEDLELIRKPWIKFCDEKWAEIPNIDEKISWARLWNYTWENIKSTFEDVA